MSATSENRCGRCGYIVRGLTGNRCPECGGLFIEVGVYPQPRSRRRLRTIAVIASVFLISSFAGSIALLSFRRAVMAQRAALQAWQQAQAAQAAQAAATQLLSQTLSNTARRDQAASAATQPAEP